MLSRLCSLAAAVAITSLTLLGSTAARADRSLFVGERDACVIEADGAAKCWGANDSNQLLTPAASPAKGVATPTAVEGLKGARALAFSADHGCAALATGKVTCWGRARFLKSPAPAALAIDKVVQLASSIHLSCARKQDGTVWCWGWNEMGQLGDGSKAPQRDAPGAVPGIKGSKGVALTSRSACAITGKGGVACWGEATEGEVGDGTLGAPCGDTTCRAKPVAVKGLDHVAQIAGGGVHLCATLGDGTVRCWGANDYGQLGDGTQDGAPCGYQNHSKCRLTPVAVAGLSGVAEVGAGLNFSCARTTDGRVACWGKDMAGDMKAAVSTKPVFVPGITDAIALGVGEGDACVLRKSGAVSCWGRNVFGQDGAGDFTPHAAPANVGL